MNGERPKKKRTWIWVVVGIFVFFIIVAAGGLFFAVSFFRQNMTVTATSLTAAEQEFEAVRARFGGRKPLFQLVDGRAQMISDTGTESAPPREVSTVHVLAWDRDDEQLMRLSIPFWLLRLKSGPIQVSAYSAGLDDRGLSFRIEDLERRGAGLLLDVPDQRDGQLLIWAE